jgi:hypothetical protein
MEEAESSMPPPAAPPAAAPAPRITEEEANKIQAQLLKAEMMGDEDRIRELKGKLAQLREAQKVVVLSGLGTCLSSPAPRRSRVVLTPIP